MTVEPDRRIDQEILGLIRDLSIATPALIAKKANRDRRYVANRMSKLEKLGYLERVARGVYKARDR